MLWECDGGIGNGVIIWIRRGEKTQKKGWGGDQNPLGATASGVPFLTVPFRRVRSSWEGIGVESERNRECSGNVRRELGIG